MPMYEWLVPRFGISKHPGALLAAAGGLSRRLLSVRRHSQVRRKYDRYAAQKIWRLCASIVEREMGKPMPGRQAWEC